jgi:hypothetical protein
MRQPKPLKLLTLSVMTPIAHSLQHLGFHFRLKHLKWARSLGHFTFRTSWQTIPQSTLWNPTSLVFGLFKCYLLYCSWLDSHKKTPIIPLSTLSFLLAFFLEHLSPSENLQDYLFFLFRFLEKVLLCHSSYHGTHCAVQVGLEIVILLPQCPNCWEYKHVLPCLLMWLFLYTLILFSHCQLVGKFAFQ